jgi:hypothetical protein
MKKATPFYFLFCLLLGMFQFKIIKAVQNPAMIMTPRYYNVQLDSWSTLPTGTSNDSVTYYQGQVAADAQNIMMNAAGTDILFFIVDNHIYNKFGVESVSGINEFYYPITYTYNGNSYTISNPQIFPLFEVYNHVRKTEMVIIPDPGNCNGYYIICNSATNTSAAPILNYVNIPPLGPRNNNQYFNTQAIEPGDVGYNPDDPEFTYLNDVMILSGSGLGFIAPDGGDVSYPAYKNEVSMGVTKLNANNERYFIYENSGAIGSVTLYVYKINSTGITYQGKMIVGGVNYSLSNEPELEIKETAVAGEYKVAFTSGADELLYYGKINVNSLTFSGFTTALYDNNYSSESNPIRGIEFSPSGRYLYVLKEGGLDIFGYFDTDLTTPTFQNLTAGLSNAANYEGSQLELAYDGRLFFTSNTQYVQVANPNTPGGLVTTTNFPVGFTHPTRWLQDQIDGMDYSAHFLANTACCVQNTSYNKVDFTAIANATWTPTNNPLNNGSGAEVTIGHELRIPAGKVITIDGLTNGGLTIKFAPDAKLIIENSVDGLNGGRLILKNCTLTVDTRCSSIQFWSGVEVWGTNLQPQGTYTSGKQGWLKMEGNSMIEKAETGVYCGKRDGSGIFITNSGGGVVQGGSVSISTARIRNCYGGAVFAHYGQTSVSVFERFTFETTAALIEPVDPYIQLFLNNVTGIKVRGCTFQNTYLPTLASTYETISNKRGWGIFSYDANFDISSSVQIGGTTVTSKFINLSMGINANDFYTANTYGCYNSNFTNCVKGIYNNSVDLSITLNPQPIN